MGPREEKLQVDSSPPGPGLLAGIPTAPMPAPRRTPGRPPYPLSVPGEVTGSGVVRCPNHMLQARQLQCWHGPREQALNAAPSNCGALRSPLGQEEGAKEAPGCFSRAFLSSTSSVVQELFGKGSHPLAGRCSGSATNHRTPCWASGQGPSVTQPWDGGWAQQRGENVTLLAESHSGDVASGRPSCPQPGGWRPRLPVFPPPGLAQGSTEHGTQTRKAALAEADLSSLSPRGPGAGNTAEDEVSQAPHEEAAQ